MFLHNTAWKKNYSTFSACRPCIACSRIGCWLPLMLLEVGLAMCFEFCTIPAEVVKEEIRLPTNCCWWTVGIWRATGWSQHQLEINTGSALGANLPNNQPDLWLHFTNSNRINCTRIRQTASAKYDDDIIRFGIPPTKSASALPDFHIFLEWIRYK